MSNSDENRNANYHDLKKYCKENIKGITNINELKKCMEECCSNMAPIEPHKDIYAADGTTNIKYGDLLETLKNIKNQVDNGDIQLPQIPLSSSAVEVSPTL
tara:strand:- start:1867 stop:2169 length:303 start_codon:yes stop_codon:yes gene_type:complete